MSEFNIRSNERVQIISDGIGKATEIVAGPGADPLEVFPNPADKERRADIVWGEDLSDDQQVAFRGVMAELGPGRSYNTGPSHDLLKNGNYVALFEGGQTHKMIAQLNVLNNMVLNNTDKPEKYFVSGSTGRVIGDAEKKAAFPLLFDGFEEALADRRLLPKEPLQVGDTEFDVARQVAMTREGFSYHGRTVDMYPEEMYEMHTAGFLKGVEVVMVALHRLPDGSQLNNEQKIAVVAEAMKHHKAVIGEPTPPLTIGVVTSSTYRPSNEIAAVKAAHATGAIVEVLSYGTDELARVKGVQPAQPSIAQLGGEAHKTARLLKEL